jgi:hypothetical protein
MQEATCNTTSLNVTQRLQQRLNHKFASHLAGTSTGTKAFCRQCRSKPGLERQGERGCSHRRDGNIHHSQAHNLHETVHHRMYAVTIKDAGLLRRVLTRRSWHILSPGVVRAVPPAIIGQVTDPVGNGFRVEYMVRDFDTPTSK